MKVSELKGPARQLFESWRSLGKTEAQALVEVERSGIVEEQRRHSAATSPEMRARHEVLTRWVSPATADAIIADEAKAGPVATIEERQATERVMAQAFRRAPKDVA